MTPTPSPQQEPAPGLSRRQALAVTGGLAAAAAAAGSMAFAPAAAAAEGPGGGGPGETETMPSVSLAQAEVVVAAAEQEAQSVGVSMNIVVIDVCGDVKAVARQDGNARAALTLAPLKAQTALAFRTPTATLAQNTTDPVRAQSFLAAGFTLLGGGVPLQVGDQVVGAIGVGGGTPEQDVQVAEAGAGALDNG
jgi:glc operon protein GlcG